MPSPNDDPVIFANWLEAYGKLKRVEALRAETSAEWQTKNGGLLGNANKDFTVANTPIVKGTKYSDFIIANQKKLIEARDSALRKKQDDENATVWYGMLQGFARGMKPAGYVGQPAPSTDPDLRN